MGIVHQSYNATCLGISIHKMKLRSRQCKEPVNRASSHGTFRPGSVSAMLFGRNVPNFMDVPAKIWTFRPTNMDVPAKKIIIISLPSLFLRNVCMSSACCSHSNKRISLSVMSFSHLCLGFSLLLFPATIPCIFVTRT